jgi:threonine dehydratase
MASPDLSLFRPRLEAVPLAHAALDPLFRDSPLLEVPAWAPDGGSAVCKVETLNPIRSFKARGAFWLVHELLASGRPVPLCCASAGNFGQGLAWAARAAGLRCVVFAATSANPLKVARMRELGAEVRLGGADFDSAKDLARAAAAAEGLLFVEDGRERAIAEGAATLAFEMLREGPPPDAVYVPLGNGALILGMAAWLKAHSPPTRVIGVCAAGAPAMALSFAAKAPRPTAEARTIADGIGVRIPVPEAVELMDGLVDQVVLVGEEEIRAAMRAVFSTLGLVVEPAGAAGLAALLDARRHGAGGRLATVLCGGNIAAGLLPELIAG